MDMGMRGAEEYLGKGTLVLYGQERVDVLLGEQKLLTGLQQMLPDVETTE